MNTIASAGLGLLLMFASLVGCSIDTQHPVDPGAGIDFAMGPEGTPGVGDSAIENRSGITYLHYSYNNPFGMCGYSYTVEVQEDGSATFSYQTDEYFDLDGMTCTIDADMVAELERICLENKVGRWNGFSMYNPFVSDGDGFYLSIDYADGGSVTADGSNASPKGLGAFEKELDALFAPVCQQLREEYRQQKIEKGVSGELDAMMLVYIQHGDSGSDSYDVFIVSEGEDEVRFDVQIDSRSGEFFEPGKYRYYMTLPKEAVDLEGFSALIKKYDLVTWMDWDETAEDYANCEWFQIDLTFDEGYIGAHGTQHPANYDEFRAEALQLLADVIANASENYGLVQSE